MSTSTGLLWIVFYIFNLIATLIQQSLDDTLIKSMQRESFTLGIIVVLIVFTSLCLDILFSSIFLFIKSKFYLRLHWKQDLFSTLGDLTRETLKSIGNASLWCFCGVWPGISRFIDYNFIPFLVFLNKDYQEGRIESLQFLRSHAQPIKGKLTLIWILFTIISPLFINILFSEFQSFSETPLKASLIVLLESTLHLLWFSILYRFYMRISLGNSCKLYTEAIDAP
jgi:hypothetical protein